MTVGVAIYCEDGVVLASDSQITFDAASDTSRSFSSTKVQKACDGFITTCSGGTWQSSIFNTAIADRVSRVLKQPNINNDTLVDEIKQEIAVKLDTCGPLFQANGPSELQGAVGYVYEGDHHCRFFVNPSNCSPLDNTSFWATFGSGGFAAGAFMANLLRIILCCSPPSVNKGRLLAYLCVDFAIKVGTTGVGGPVQMAKIERNGPTRNSANAAGISKGGYTVEVCDIRSIKTEFSNQIDSIGDSIRSVWGKF